MYCSTVVFNCWRSRKQKAMVSFKTNEGGWKFFMFYLKIYILEGMYLQYSDMLTIWFRAPYDMM